MAFPENAFKGFQTIVDANMQNLRFDKTELCTIIDAKNANAGYYKVQSDEMTFYALSSNTSYEENDQVYVLIQNGDYSNDKIIIGKKVDIITAEDIANNNPNTFIPMTDNIWNTKTQIEVKTDGDYYQIKQKSINKYLTPTVLRNQTYTKIKLDFDLLTQAPLAFYGRFFLRVSINGVESGNEQFTVNKIKDIYQNDFIGNSLNTQIPIHQSFILDIPLNLTRVSYLNLQLNLNKIDTSISPNQERAFFTKEKELINTKITISNINIQFGTTLSKISNTSEAKIYFVDKDGNPLQDITSLQRLAFYYGSAVSESDFTIFRRAKLDLLILDPKQKQINVITKKSELEDMKYSVKWQYSTQINSDGSVGGWTDLGESDNPFLLNIRPNAIMSGSAYTKFRVQCFNILNQLIVQSNELTVYNSTKDFFYTQQPNDFKAVFELHENGISKVYGPNNTLIHSMVSSNQYYHDGFEIYYKGLPLADYLKDCHNTIHKVIYSFSGGGNIFHVGDNRLQSMADLQDVTWVISTDNKGIESVYSVISNFDVSTGNEQKQEGTIQPNLLHPTNFNKQIGFYYKFNDIKLTNDPIIINVTIKSEAFEEGGAMFQIVIDPQTYVLPHDNYEFYLQPAIGTTDIVPLGTTIGKKYYLTPHFRYNNKDIDMDLQYNQNFFVSWDKNESLFFDIRGIVDNQIELATLTDSISFEDFNRKCSVLKAQYIYKNKIYTTYFPIGVTDLDQDNIAFLGTNEFIYDEILTNDQSKQYKLTNKFFNKFQFSNLTGILSVSSRQAYQHKLFDATKLKEEILDYFKENNSSTFNENNSELGLLYYDSDNNKYIVPQNYNQSNNNLNGFLNNQNRSIYLDKQYYFYKITSVLKQIGSNVSYEELSSYYLTDNYKYYCYMINNNNSYEFTLLTEDNISNWWSLDSGQLTKGIRQITLFALPKLKNNAIYYHGTTKINPELDAANNNTYYYFTDIYKSDTLIEDIKTISDRNNCLLNSFLKYFVRYDYPTYPEANVNLYIKQITNNGSGVIIYYPLSLHLNEDFVTDMAIEIPPEHKYENL